MKSWTYNKKVNKKVKPAKTVVALTAGAAPSKVDASSDGLDGA